MKNKQTISILIAILLLAITFSANAQNTISPEFAKFWSELQKDKKATAQSYMNNVVIGNSAEGQYVFKCKPNSIDKKQFTALKKTNIDKIEMFKNITSKFSEEYNTIDIDDANGKKLKTVLTKNVFKDFNINIESEFYKVPISTGNYGLSSSIFAKVKGVFKIVMLEYIPEDSGD